MNTRKQFKKLSKFLSLILRHKPDTIGIKLDDSGWTDVDSLISKMNDYGISIDLETLILLVETNNKKRFAFNQNQTKIRANQGHSVNIELGYKAKMPPETLYHGTGNKSVKSILKKGIEKRKRHHVHLSLDIETALNVGRRHGKPVVFEILSKQMFEDGFEFFLSKNGVWLTDNVPVKYLRKFENNNG